MPTRINPNTNHRRGGHRRPASPAVLNHSAPAASASTGHGLPGQRQPQPAGPMDPLSWEELLGQR